MEMKILLSEISLHQDQLLRTRMSYLYKAVIIFFVVFCRITFQSAIVVSATSLVLERQEGMLDRTYVAGWLGRSIILYAYRWSLFLGVTIAELILSELLLYSIIGIAQVVVITTVVYAVFDVSHHRDLYMIDLSFTGSNAWQYCFSRFHLLAYFVVR